MRKVELSAVTMWPDWVPNREPLAIESDTLLTVLRGPASSQGKGNDERLCEMYKSTGNL